MIVFLIICLPITITNYHHIGYKYLHLFLIHGFLFSLYNITLISVYSKIQLSTLQPLSFLKVLMNIGLSNIFFGTNIPINKFAGMTFIIFGSLAIKKSNNSSSQE
jgi:drug/metabolite transporter (DMT)-like permease